MTALIHEKLFEFITDIDSNYNIENTLKYLKKEALTKNISDEILEMAWNEEFARLADGKKYSTLKCTCGCGQETIGADFIHSIRDRMIDLDKKQTEIVKNFMQDRYKMFLSNEMKRISKFDKEREKLIKGSLWEQLTDWPTSSIYCMLSKKYKYKDHKINKIKSRLKRIEKYSGN